MKFMKKIAAMAAATAVAAVSLVSMGSMGASATDEPPYTAYLCISAGGDAQWKAGDWETESATITGDGVYSTSVTIPEDKGSETIEFLMLSQTSMRMRLRRRELPIRLLTALQKSRSTRLKL